MTMPIGVYPHKSKPIADRFWAKVDKSGQCWIWIGARGGTMGYGKMTKGGKTDGHIRAHRFAWELAHGDIPAGLWVLHHCDNPPCVKTDPDEKYPEGHLFLGTRADNMADCAAKGRINTTIARATRAKNRNARTLGAIR
jgi:hypothetical protein